MSHTSSRVPRPASPPSLNSKPTGVGTNWRPYGHSVGVANASSSSDVNVTNVVISRPQPTSISHMQTPVAVPYQTPPPITYAPQGWSKHTLYTSSTTAEWSASEIREQWGISTSHRPTSIPRKALRPPSKAFQWSRAGSHFGTF
jgi:hypothetical protein